MKKTISCPHCPPDTNRIVQTYTGRPPTDKEMLADHIKKNHPVVRSLDSSISTIETAVKARHTLKLKCPLCDTFEICFIYGHLVPYAEPEIDLFEHLETLHNFPSDLEDLKHTAAIFARLGSGFQESYNQAIYTINLKYDLAEFQLSKSIDATIEDIRASILAELNYRNKPKDVTP